MTPPAAPRVSVVTATYGRPEVLRWAIDSVMRQTLTDWELLVVGDACDDTTAELVRQRAGHDSRIRFINLQANHGEQSGPNNVGVARSTGRYIAFLNQDDLWFPDHLAQLVDWLEATGADLVHGLSAHLPPGQAHPQEHWHADIAGSGHEGRFDPLSTFSPASAWLLTRSCAQAVGPWRPALHCRSESSQDFLYRAWRQGMHMSACPVLTVLVFSSGNRPGSYTHASDDEQAFFSQRMMQAPPLRPRLMMAGHFVDDGFIGRPTASLLSPLERWCWTRLAAWGLHPRAWHLRRQGAARAGSYIRRLRLTRGLDAAPPHASRGGLRTAARRELCDCPLQQAVLFTASSQGWRYQGEGWSTAEPAGCWTDGPQAHLFVRPPPAPQARYITLELGAFVSKRHPRQRLTVKANGHTVFDGMLDTLALRKLRLPLADVAARPDGVIDLRLHLPDAVSPAKVKRHASDRRRLGVQLHALLLESD